MKFTNSHLGVARTDNRFQYHSILFIYSFTEQIFKEHLLCTRHCNRCQRFSSGQKKSIFSSLGLYSKVEFSFSLLSIFGRHSCLSSSVNMRLQVPSEMASLCLNSSNLLSVSLIWNILHVTWSASCNLYICFVCLKRL